MDDGQKSVLRRQLFDLGHRPATRMSRAETALSPPPSPAFPFCGAAEKALRRSTTSPSKADAYCDFVTGDEFPEIALARIRIKTNDAGVGASDKFPRRHRASIRQNEQAEAVRPC